MPSALHPQAKFDPIPPDLDLHGLVEKTPNFKWVQRVSRSQIRGLGPQAFEKLVRVHVIQDGKPLVIEGWTDVLPKRLFNAKWLEEHYDKKQEKVRDISSASDIPMTIGHYLRSMKKLANQWSPTNFREELRQRLYLKDIDCPAEWHEALQKAIYPSVFYLNENISSTGDKGKDDDLYEDKFTAAQAGDLMSSLPPSMRAENLMCYVGHEGTYTPAHREMCASLGQNIMVEASGNTDGEKPGSSIWFMTESKDREVVREYFLSMLGHDIEIEKHFAQINAWKKATFDVYVAEQKPGDFILIPPLAAHQVWNRGTRTMKVAWNRTTAETLKMAMHEALPKARLVCRDEQYKNKAMIYYTLQKYHRELSLLGENGQKTQMDFLSLGQGIITNSPRVKGLASDFEALFHLFAEILVDETFGYREKDVEFVEFDSCITCAYCRSNIFNRFLTCKHCVRPLINGEDDQYDVCMECYAMGRSCACLSGLQWCEQWAWSDLVDSYETWRAMVIKNHGYFDVEQSLQPLEIACQRSGKKSLAQICQEALKRRPFRNVMQPVPTLPPSGSEGEAKSSKKRKKRKKKNGEVRRCHVCCHPDYSYRVHECTNPGCSEAYCYGVLYRAFDMMPQKVLQDEQWQCPRCLGICNCGACRRTGLTTPYAPKNTSLGHDTRAVADDRSVEALVDFRLHNLSWLKAAGEEGRSKDSKRMKRLQHLAQTAKSTDLVEQLQNSKDTPDGSLNKKATDLSTAESQIAGPTSRDPSTWSYGESQGAELGNNDSNSNADDEGASAYPDPSIVAQQRIGQLYYCQDGVSSQDKILFDPFQAPTVETLRMAEEPEVPDFIKKSIRAAKRKAKRENEDPEYRFQSRRKKLQANNEADMLDNMDPALFGGESARNTGSPAAAIPGHQESDWRSPQPRAERLSGEVSVDIEEARAQTGARQAGYTPNEPMLRHAKPRTSYAEMDEAEETDEEMEEEIIDPPKITQNSLRRSLSSAEQRSAVDVAAPTIGSVAASRAVESPDMSSWQATMTQYSLNDGNNSSSPQITRRQGRPQTETVHEHSTLATTTGKSLKADSKGDAADTSLLLSDIHTPKAPRGRPRKILKLAISDDENERRDVANHGPAGSGGIGPHAEVKQHLREQENKGSHTRRSLRFGANNMTAANGPNDSSDNDSTGDSISGIRDTRGRGRGRGRPSGRARSRGRGRPSGQHQGSAVAENARDHRNGAATARSPSLGETQLMSMAERQAAGGKPFKTASRRPRGRPPKLSNRKTDEPASPRAYSAIDMGGSDGGEPGNHSSQVEAVSPGMPPRSKHDSSVQESTAPTIVRLPDEDEYMSVSVSISDDDSDKNEDIPAIAMSTNRRGRGKPRGAGRRGYGGRGRGARNGRSTGF